jgi:hypothetical protein
VTSEYNDPNFVMPFCIRIYHGCGGNILKRCVFLLCCIFGVPTLFRIDFGHVSRFTPQMHNVHSLYLRRVKPIHRQPFSNLLLIWQVGIGTNTQSDVHLFRTLTDLRRASVMKVQLHSHRSTPTCQSYLRSL